MIIDSGWVFLDVLWILIDSGSMFFKFNGCFSTNNYCFCFWCVMNIRNECSRSLATIYQFSISMGVPGAGRAEYPCNKTMTISFGFPIGGHPQKGGVDKTTTKFTISFFMGYIFESTPDHLFVVIPGSHLNVRFVDLGDLLIMPITIPIFTIWI